MTTLRKDSVVPMMCDYASEIVLLTRTRVGGPLLIWYSPDGVATKFEKDGLIYQYNMVLSYRPDPNTAI